MDLQLSDKVVLVTGASGGIGRALLAAFAAEGCKVGALGHARHDEMVAWIEASPWPGSILPLRCDVCSVDDQQRAVDAAAERFGRVDVAIACAGVWPPEDRPLHELPPERVRRTVEVNLLGAAWTARAFLRALAASGPRADGHGASLLLIGSTAGRFGERGHADYAAAKAGLLGLCQSLKNEIVDLDPFGRVNVIQPGWTVTHMARPALSQPGRVAAVVATMPLRQLARAADIASVAVALASPRLSRHITGEVLTVAGGMEGRVRWQPGDVDESAVRARLSPD